MGVPSLATDLQTLGNPNLVIGIVSDIHLRGSETADTFIHTLEYFRSQKVDGVIIAGDMADQGLEPQLQVVADAWYKVFPDNKGLDGKYTEKLFICQAARYLQRSEGRVGAMLQGEILAHMDEGGQRILLHRCTLA